MKITTHPFGRQAIAVALLALFSVVPKAAAVDAVLLDDTVVDNGSSGKPVPNATNYGTGSDLRVFKGGGRVGRAFLKFSLDSMPPGTTADDVTQARVTLWVNSNSTVLGAVTITPLQVRGTSWR